MSDNMIPPEVVEEMKRLSSGFIRDRTESEAYCKLIDLMWKHRAALITAVETVPVVEELLEHSNYQRGEQQKRIAELEAAGNDLAARLKLWGCSDGEMLCREDAAYVRAWDALKGGGK